ncbi:MAG: hypothetical protein QW356_05465 [Candidatus Hadarchaeales archaeon]
MAAPVKAVVTRILPPDKWIERQIGNLKAVGEANFRTGISMPAKDPIVAGINAEPVYAAQVKLAIEQERRKKALMATNIDEWYSYAQNIGAPRLVEGVTKREKEVHDFVKPWNPILLEHLSKIDPMPTTTLKERIDKAVKNIEGLAALHGVWRGK